ncbi:MAG: rhodanese-like domain-containing protein [Thermoanaerobaculia bacterium]|nr:rhodanese-like domain-containing protein [Thermoanaerobaculia bacterium]
MSNPHRQSLLSILFLTSFLVTSFASAETTAKTIDFQSFLEVSAEVQSVREARLLPVEAFLELAQEPDTILIDTRSGPAYASMHLAGAVHLNLSDLTEQSLRRVIGDPSKTVLIYCNNNFSDGRAPFATKAPAAALNIPTFITLWTYGYQNVYELGDLLELSDPRLTFEGDEVRTP